MKLGPIRPQVVALAVLLLVALAVWLASGTEPHGTAAEDGGTGGAASSSGTATVPHQETAFPWATDTAAPPPSAQLNPSAATAPSRSRTARRTGEQRGTALSDEGRALLREQMRRDFEGLEPVQHADGSISLDLQGRFRHVTAVVTTPDGGTRIQCFSDAEILFDRLGSPP